MVDFHTTCGSIIGAILYSDTFALTPGMEDDHPRKASKLPALNVIEAIPVFGILGGVSRIGIAIIHIIGHTFAAVIFWDRGHLCHVVKGGAELLRGLIVIIPIVGRIFVWKYDMRQPCLGGGYTHETFSFSFFLVKIVNPNNPDPIDNYRNGKHPLAD